MDWWSEKVCTMKKRFNQVLLFLIAVVLFVNLTPVFSYAAENAADGITVSFRLIGDTYHTDGVTDHNEYMDWIPTTVYTMPQGSSMCDVFIKAIEDHGLEQEGATSGYVESIKAPTVLGAYWLGEFDNGANSGWMYTVNGIHPQVGLTDYMLKDGDEIVWHYVDNYVLEERNPNSAYYGRWLEADGLTPLKYIWKSCKLDKVSDENYTLSMAAVPENVLIVAAGYRTNGQMVECQLLEENDFQYEAGYIIQKSLAIRGDSVKVFMLDPETYALKKWLGQ